MAGGLLKYFFERDTSIAHVIGAGAVCWSLYRHAYVLAVVAFVLFVVICAIGELALERK